MKVKILSYQIKQMDIEIDMILMKIGKKYGAQDIGSGAGFGQRDLEFDVSSVSATDMVQLLQEWNSIVSCKITDHVWSG